MKKKEFDCVEMKWNIQQKLQQEYEKMDDVSAHKKQLTDVLQNPILGPFIKKIRSRENQLERYINGRSGLSLSRKKIQRRKTHRKKSP